MKCARTRCPNTLAVCRHTDNGQLYCVPCARKINEYHATQVPPGTPPLVPFPTHEEYRAMREEIRKAKPLD